MVDRPAQSALRDILGAIGEIEDYVAGMDLGAYLADGRTRGSVGRCIEIISEASRKVPDDIKARHPQIPWPAIRGIGNMLRHEYGAVDDEIMWQAATKSLKELEPVIKQLIADLETS
jgi:uncharacterized protein with HEPN domain